MRSRGGCARRRARGVAAACGDARGPARTRNDPTSRSRPSPMPSPRRHRWLPCAPPHSLRFGPSGAFARTPERSGPPYRPLLPRCDVRTWDSGTWAWGSPSSSPRCDEGGAAHPVGRGSSNPRPIMCRRPARRQRELRQHAPHRRALAAEGAPPSTDWVSAAHPPAPQVGHHARNPTPGPRPGCPTRSSSDGRRLPTPRAVVPAGPPARAAHCKLRPRQVGQAGPIGPIQTSRPSHRR